MGRWLEQVSPPINWRQDASDLERWAEFNYNARLTGKYLNISSSRPRANTEAAVNHSMVEVPRMAKLANVTEDIPSSDLIGVPSST